MWSVNHEPCAILHESFRSFDGDDIHALGACFVYFLNKSTADARFLHQDGVGMGHVVVLKEAELVVAGPLLMSQRDAALTLQNAVDDLDALFL